MIGYYKKTRKDIAKLIRKSPVTQDGYHVCKSFPYWNNTIGNKKDNQYYFDRSYFEHKLCFNQADIENYLEEDKSNYDINRMKSRDEFVYDIIKDMMDYKLKKKIPKQQYSLSELIDSAIFYFNYKY